MRNTCFTILCWFLWQALDHSFLSVSSFLLSFFFHQTFYLSIYPSIYLPTYPLLIHLSSTAHTNIQFIYKSLQKISLFIFILFIFIPAILKLFLLYWWHSLLIYTCKITADGDCSHEIERHLLLGRKVMTNLDSIFKSRDITLPTKVHLVKAMVFPVVMYGCKSWTVKKAGHWRIDAFELWCQRRLLRVPWTARRFNQSILKEISPGCSLEGLMVKLKLQYFGHLMQRIDSLEKTLMLGGIGGRRRRGWQDEMAGWHHWLNGHEFGWTPGVGDGQGGLACCDSWVTKSRTWLSNWTEDS